MLRTLKREAKSFFIFVLEKGCAFHLHRALAGRSIDGEKERARPPRPAIATRVRQRELPAQRELSPMVWPFGLDPTPTMDSHPYQKRRGALCLIGISSAWRRLGSSRMWPFEQSAWPTPSAYARDGSGGHVVGCTQLKIFGR